MTQVYESLTADQKREVRMYGCTVDQMREAVEQSITFRFRFNGPAMMAASLMSDCQEMLEHGGDDYNTQEDVRQALNRAKWILFTYVMKQA